MADATYQSILSNVVAGKFAPIYLLHGVEPFFVDQLTQAIMTHALTDAERAFNQLVFYGRDMDSKTIIDTASQYPMMAQRRLIVVKEAQVAPSALRQLESYAAKPVQSTVLVLSHPHKKVDGRLGLVKQVKKTGIVFESKPLYDNQVPGWIGTYLGKKGLQITPDAVSLLVEYVGTELAVLANELDKLQLTLSNVKIEENHVFDHVGISKEYNVFEFQKAIGMRDRVKVERIVRNFISNMKAHPVPMIVGTLYAYFTRMLIVKGMSGSSDKAIASALGLGSSYFVREYILAAANYTTAQLERIIGVLKKYDLMSKGVASHISVESALRDMVFEIMSAKK